MDCRTFRSRLEDYLEGGLDFPSRFGMERHAQQCFSCGKTVTDAQELARVARECHRVSAPPGFEASVMQRIQAAKGRRGFLRNLEFRLWSFDRLSLRWVAAGISSVVLLGLGTFLVLRFAAGGHQESGAATVAQSERGLSPQVPVANPTGLEEASQQNPIASMPIRTGRAVDPELPFREMESADSDFVDWLIPGPDNRMRVVRLPRTIRMRYQHPSKMYFIRNVSH